MNNKRYAFIPVLISFVMIPQLLYYWLAPRGATAGALVYIGGSILTIVAPTLFSLLYLKYGIQKSAGLAIVTGILNILTLIICFALLWANASIRTTIYVLLILVFIFIMCITPMFVCSILESDQETNSVPRNTESRTPLPPRNR